LICIDATKEKLSYCSENSKNNQLDLNNYLIVTKENLNNESELKIKKKMALINLKHILNQTLKYQKKALIA